MMQILVSGHGHLLIPIYSGIFSVIKKYDKVLQFEIEAGVSRDFAFA